MKVLYLFIFTIILALTGCSSDTITGTNESDLLVEPYNLTSSVKTPKMVPLKGTGAGSGYIDESRLNCPEGTLRVSGEGSGPISHLGQTNVFFSHCAYYLVDPNNPNYTDGFVELRSANGDMIYAEYSGYTTGPESFINFNTITEGTGRFEGVSGTYTETGSITFTDTGFDFELEIEGMISTVGSGKK